MVKPYGQAAPFIINHIYLLIYLINDFLNNKNNLIK